MVKSNIEMSYDDKHWIKGYRIKRILLLAIFHHTNMGGPHLAVVLKGLRLGKLDGRAANNHAVATKLISTTRDQQKITYYRTFSIFYRS